MAITCISVFPNQEPPVATRWLALGPFVRDAAGQAVIGRIRALIKGRSPATNTSDAPGA
jgi:hypothetical protein